MALNVSRSRVLKDALAYPEGGTFEESLGRSVRRHGGDYREPGRLHTLVRQWGRARRLVLPVSARWLADQT